jgi:hypothetical protein
MTASPRSRWSRDRSGPTRGPLAPGGGPTKISGWVAASATDLTGASAPLAWLRGYCPVRTLGGSFFDLLLRHPADVGPRSDHAGRALSRIGEPPGRPRRRMSGVRGMRA